MPRPKTNPSAVGHRRPHKRKKNNPIEKLSDGAFICEKKLLGWTGERIHEGLNERRMGIARAAALERGATKAEAEKAAEDARVSTWTIAKDTSQMLAALREINPLTAEMLLRERMLQLEEEIIRLNLVEREAWDSFFASKRSWEEEDAVTPTGRPRRGTSKRKHRTPEASFLAVALKCGEKRVEYGEKIYDLAAKLGLATMLPAEIKELHGVGADDLEALCGYAVRHLWSAEGMIAGNEALAQERFRLMFGALNQARQLAGRGSGKGGDAPGAPIVHELVFSIVPGGGTGGAN